MDKQPYDVRASVLVRHIVEQSKKNGHLQRLKEEYEQMQLDQLAMEFNEKLHIEKAEIYQSGSGDGLELLFEEDICPLAKRKRIQDVKQRLRVALRLHLDGPDQADKTK